MAIEEPIPSVVTSANEASSRQTAAAGASWPEGAAARSSLSSSAGVSAIELGQYVASKDRCLQKIRIALSDDGSQSDRPDHRRLERDRRGDGAPAGPRARRQLVLVARREERLRALAESLPCPATHVAADLTDDDAPAAGRATTSPSSTAAG